MDFKANINVNSTRLGYLFSMLTKQIVNSAVKKLDDFNKMTPLSDSKEKEKIRVKKLAHGQKEGSYDRYDMTAKQPHLSGDRQQACQ